ncbi:hypothetical protein D3C73_1105790 [compost metagenome]
MKANRVSDTIIWPSMVSGSRRLAWFQKALPMTEATMATPAQTPIRRIQASSVMPPSMNNDGMTSASARAPVTTPVSSDHSCGVMSGNRPIQRLLPTAKAVQDSRAATAQTRPIRVALPLCAAAPPPWLSDSHPIRPTASAATAMGGATRDSGGDSLSLRPHRATTTGTMPTIRAEAATPA